MSEYEVLREATIDADPATVYDAVVNLRRWESWSPWADLDPDMETAYSGTDGEVGSTYTWKGNRKAGEGSMTVTEASEPDTVVIDLEFLKPFKSESVTRFDLEKAAGGTHVTWTMTGTHSTLSKIFDMVRPMDKLIGGDFENGLARLKEYIET